MAIADPSQIIEFIESENINYATSSDWPMSIVSSDLDPAVGTLIVGGTSASVSFVADSYEHKFYPWTNETRHKDGELYSIDTTPHGVITYTIILTDCPALVVPGPACSTETYTIIIHRDSAKEVKRLQKLVLETDSWKNGGANAQPPPIPAEPPVLTADDTEIIFESFYYKDAKVGDVRIGTYDWTVQGKLFNYPDSGKIIAPSGSFKRAFIRIPPGVDRFTISFGVNRWINRNGGDYKWATSIINYSDFNDYNPVVTYGTLNYNMVNTDWNTTPEFFSSKPYSVEPTTEEGLAFIVMKNESEIADQPQYIGSATALYRVSNAELFNTWSNRRA